RNSGQAIGIFAARNMHADYAFRINLRRKKIGQIATIFNVCAYQLLQRMVRISNTVSNHTQFRQGHRRLDQKFIQFGGPFIVAPVADPDHVNFFSALERMELLDVSGFMKSPCPVDAETININAADGFAKRENAIHQVQMELEDLSCASVSAMVAIMEQCDEAELFLQREHLVHHLRIVPLMQQDEVCFFQFLFEKMGKLGVTGLVETNIELRVSAAERINGLNGALALLLHQVGKRPRTQLFITSHGVAHADQFTHQPAQKMGIAMVPVRNNGMGKKGDIELLTHALRAWTGARL